MTIIIITVDSKPERIELSWDQDAIKFFELVTAAHVTVYKSNLTWEEKYDIIFSDEISAKIWRLPFSLDDYFDWDASYEEDVMTFVSALRRTADRLEPSYYHESMIWTRYKQLWD